MLETSHLYQWRYLTSMPQTFFSGKLVLSSRVAFFLSLQLHAHLSLLALGGNGDTDGALWTFLKNNPYHRFLWRRNTVCNFNNNAGFQHQFSLNNSKLHWMRMCYFGFSPNWTSKWIIVFERIVRAANICLIIFFNYHLMCMHNGYRHKFAVKQRS